MSQPISSPSNPKARYVRRLGARAFRAKERRFVVEGVRVVEEALASGSAFDFALASAELSRTDRGRRLVASLREAGVPLYEISTGVLSEISDIVTSQGVLAVLEWPELAWPDQAGTVLVLDGLRDPGNVGTVMRTALAAAVDGIILAPGTADPTSPKVVRAAAGAHFRIPLRRAPWHEIADLAAAAGLEVWVADAAGDARFDRVDWALPHMLVVGGEASGPCDEARQLGRTVRIPMPGGAESLNAAVAAAVLLFEAVRQRTAG